MPRPPSSARSVGRADRAGRHRPGRGGPEELPQWDSWDTWSEDADETDAVDRVWDTDVVESGGEPGRGEPFAASAGSAVEGHDGEPERPGEEGWPGEGEWTHEEAPVEGSLANAGRESDEVGLRRPHRDAGLPPAEGDGHLEGPQLRRVPLLSVPESLRSLDLQVGARAVRGLLLLAVVVALVLGARWWWVHQRASAVPVEEAMEQVVDGGVVAGPGADDEGVGSSEEQERASEPAVPAGGESGAMAGDISVVVHVVGEIQRPGIVELPAGARVADAVAAAGGLTDAADQASLNLARVLVDGEQVWVGAPGEEPPPGVTPGAAAPGSGTGGAGAGGGASGGGADGPARPVDLNTATQAELEELPGIGPVTAGHILAWRDEHGRFSAVEELMEISGIGERTFAQLEPLVTVGGHR